MLFNSLRKKGYKTIINEYKNSEHLNNLLAELINYYNKLKELVSIAERINRGELYDHCTEIVDSFKTFKSDIEN